jgi:hypothetical protein
MTRWGMNPNFTIKRSKRDTLPLILFLMEGKTYKEIGKMYGISRQRVQQIVHPDVFTTDIVKCRAGGKCEICKRDVLKGHIHHSGSETPEEYNNVNNLMYLCGSCHKILHRKHPKILKVKKLKIPKVKKLRIRVIKVKRIKEKIHRIPKETVVVRISIKAREILEDLVYKNNSSIAVELDKILGVGKEVDKNESSIADELDKKLGIEVKNEDRV